MAKLFSFIGLILFSVLKILCIAQKPNLYDYTPFDIVAFSVDSEKGKLVISETTSGKIRLSIWDEITGNHETISFGVDNLTQYFFDKATYKCIGITKNRVYVFDVRTRSLEQSYDFPNDNISALYPARDHEVVIFTSNPTIAYSIDFQTKKVNKFSCPGLTASYGYTAFENCGNSGYFISMHSFSPSAHMAIWNHNTRTCKVIPTYYAFRTIKYLPTLNKVAIS